MASPEVPAGEKTLKIARVGTFLLSTDAGDTVDVNCYDSPGYGDFVDNTSSIDNIKKYVLQCHKAWKSLDAQSMTESEFLLADERIHCMFYFLGSHRMKAIDREFIAALAPLVPIVPVVGKADAMTLPERATYLDTVQRNLAQISEKLGGNCVYDFDGDDLLFDTDSAQLIAASVTASPRPVAAHPNQSRASSPVARLPLPIEKSRYSDLHEHLTDRSSTFSSDEVHYDHSLSGNGKHDWSNPNLFLRQPNIFALVCDATAHRVYPWATVPIENTHFSDFRRLQTMIFETGTIYRKIESILIKI